MADQASQQSASPLTLSSNQITMRDAAFLAASRRLAAQPHTIPRMIERAQRNPLVVRHPLFKREQSTERTQVPTPTVSTECEKKRCDDTELFGNIRSNLELGGGLLEVGVVNQPLFVEEVTMAVTEEVAVLEEVAVTEEVVEEEEDRGTLALEIPKVTANAETYDGPSRVTVEEIALAEVVVTEVAVETQLELVEEKKKKKKSKWRKAREAESSHHHKEKKNKENKDDNEDEEAKKERKKKKKEERRMRRREERRLRK
ncbi:stress response protein nst1-like [Benincasa hispida]|uniref:stress response protein nst1-like n=1 Tax=Benincasa hispida TaxID=102211 RepID=UPI00190205C6|nr:stress response protein nst1-like [Benincasa hispida]